MVLSYIMLFTGPRKNSEPKNFCCFFPGRDQFYKAVFVGFVVPGAPRRLNRVGGCVCCFWARDRTCDKASDLPLHHGGFSVFFQGRVKYYRRLFFVDLLFREHPKVEPGGWFLLLCLEKPRIEPLVYLFIYLFFLRRVT